MRWHVAGRRGLPGQGRGLGKEDGRQLETEYLADMFFVCVNGTGGTYKGHVDILAPTVQELAALEKEAQTSFLHLGYLPNQLFRTF